MTETANVTLSDSAARRIREIVSAEAGKSALRVSVEGGGCSGFSYKFDLADQPADDDIVLEKDDARCSSTRCRSSTWRDPKSISSTI
jgi:iron-sulfur cluster assembly accessory protein